MLDLVVNTRQEDPKQTPEPVSNRQWDASYVAKLAADHQAACEQVVPWFFTNMPDAYFLQVPDESQRQHLRAIVAMQVSQTLTVPEIMLSSESDLGYGVQYTFIHSGATERVAPRQLESLPDGTLTRVLLTTTRDGRLSLNSFDVAPNSRWRSASAARRLEQASNGVQAVGDGLKRFVVGAGASPAEQEALARHTEYNERLEAGDLTAHAGTPMKGSRPPASFTERPTILHLPLDEFLRRCSSTYVTHQLPRLLVKQHYLYEAVRGQDNVEIEVETSEMGSRDWAAVAEGCTLLTFALPGIQPRPALLRVFRLLDLHGMQLHLAQVDTVDDPEGDGAVTLLRTVVSPEPSMLGGSRALEARWELLKADACRIKWVDEAVLRLASEGTPALTLTQAEVLLALADLSLSILDHPLLSRVGVHDRLERAEERSLARTLVDLFIARFDPAAPLAEEAFLDGLRSASKQAEASLRDHESLTLLRAMAAAVQHTMRTNLFMRQRWALTLRIEPAFFDGVLDRLPSSSGLSNRPYGVFFVAGRHFNGYHVRFSDIARGGLRVVLPPSHDAHVGESRRHFNECFRLAWAQQLKNKDIPEGGAKAVCLVAPVNKQDRTRVLHKCVKKFTDALLDLIAPRAQQPIVGRGGSNLRDPIVSRGGCEGELLYLGPDENITPHDINWISQRAAQRQYAMPAAFISSKPEAGINHKEYGVTSEGVTVFLHEGLRAIGIDPAAQPFTVKLTGGPDGDVAGNMLRILHREYAERVRVVGIADGFGCVEDPNGIPMGELLRLVDASLPTSGLDVSRLSAKGKLTLADTREGAAHRNTMHNRVVADAFVPAGGRPSTVNASNWRDFLQPDGTPSARLVVEGANLFFDGAARAALFEHCALPIIKDSSANKCGVICSSMEIVASMVLSEHEFKANKPRYVPQVLTRLRSLARLEAQMLFAERALDDSISLPELSERISVAIMRVGRALDAALDQKPPEQQRALFGFVKDGLPPALFDDESVVARAAERLPWPYQRSCISSGLASRLVYREGLGFVETLPERGLAEYALSYLQGEQRAHELAALVAKAGLSFGPEVEALLLKGGVRAATEAAIAQSKIESGTTAAYPVDLA